MTLDEKLWPRKSCKVYFFSLKKLFFGTRLTSVATTSRITKFHVHNLNTYTFSQQEKVLLLHTQVGGKFNLKSGPIFRRVYILSDFAQILFAPIVEQ